MSLGRPRHQPGYFDVAVAFTLATVAALLWGPPMWAAPIGGVAYTFGRFLWDEVASRVCWRLVEEGRGPTGALHVLGRRELGLTSVKSDGKRWVIWEHRWKGRAEPR